MKTRSEILARISEIIEQNQRGVCPSCKEICKEGSEKVVDDTFDIHWDCWNLEKRGKHGYELIGLLHDLAEFD